MWWLIDHHRHVERFVPSVNLERDALKLICLILIGTAVVVESHMTSRGGSVQNGIKLSRVKYVNSELSPDSKLESAILMIMPDYSKQFIDNPDHQVRYYYNRVDLNGDGNPETLVFLTGSYACGTGGCDLLVFRSTKEGYKLVSNLALAHNPVIVSRRKTCGWSDIILYVSGGGIVHGHFVVLRFDRQKYPDNPSVEPAIKSSAIAGTAFIADKILPSSGIVLRPTRDR